MSLPKWIKRPKEYPCFCLNCKQYRALEIAVEALEYYAGDDSGMEVNAKEAMRRIEALSK